MPLFDHFRPPVEFDLPWESLHSAWATYLATALNQRWLSRDFIALEHTPSGPHVDIDVWAERCALAAASPTMPLRLTGDRFVPVEFEATYLETCRQRRLIG